MGDMQAADKLEDEEQKLLMEIQAGLGDSYGFIPSFVLLALVPLSWRKSKNSWA